VLPRRWPADGEGGRQLVDERRGDRAIVEVRRPGQRATGLGERQRRSASSGPGARSAANAAAPSSSERRATTAAIRASARGDHRAARSSGVRPGVAAAAITAATSSATGAAPPGPHGRTSGLAATQAAVGSSSMIRARPWGSRR
jgi:hypothetical protein